MARPEAAISKPVSEVNLGENGEARLEAIWLKTGRRGPMRSVSEVTLVEKHGIDGNSDQHGYRQVTLLDADAWERATAEIGVEVDPSARRANFLLRGIDLHETADRVLKVAECRIKIRGETLPCGRMDDAAPGLKSALASAWRGGAYGTVLEGGSLAVGDTVCWES